MVVIASLIIASLLVGAGHIIGAHLTHTIVLTFHAEDYGRRHVEAASRRWLLGWSKSNAYNFPAHAAIALAEVDDGLVEGLRTYFADQARVLNAFDRTTSASITAISAIALGDVLWEIAYTLSEHEFYGLVDIGDHKVSGYLVISTRHSDRAPVLIIGFLPTS